MNKSKSILEESLVILHKEADELNIEQVKRPIVKEPIRSTTTEFDI